MAQSVQQNVVHAREAYDGMHAFWPRLCLEAQRQGRPPCAALWRAKRAGLEGIGVDGSRAAARRSVQSVKAGAAS
eukprot:2929861-Pleurochrysis_carterae.AAC.1